MRLALIALLLAASVASSQASPPDLLKLKACSSKGRFQDLQYNPSAKQAGQLVAMGAEAIPFLVSRLESARRYEEPPICFWPTMVEGDMALAILMDLFLDSTWQQTTLPESCWSALYSPGAGRDDPAYQILRVYRKRTGREAIRRHWERIWAEHRDAIRWDSTERFFRIDGRGLSPCK